METVKKNQSHMKDPVTEMTTTLQGIKSRVGEAKNQINNLDYKEAKKRRRKKNSNKKKESKIMRIV